MARHSFIQHSKLPDVCGRIDYISNPKRQEHLYATYRTDGANNDFWEKLAKENQQDFKASGADGKCIEARELIIALPEYFTEYRVYEILKTFTDFFHDRFGVECAAALHHNKTMTNYHIHLIFSERKLLDNPTVKTASRNMFYNEAGKHVRTKKEILDESGNVRDGCRIIAKGEVYEQHIFEAKNPNFKSKGFTADIKEMYTWLINTYAKDEKEKLSVFRQGSVYLPTKKIGKNNPKAEEIRADNAARQEWNQTVDVALVGGASEDAILDIKQKEITEKVSASVSEHGKKPGLFRSILNAAVEFLSDYVRRLNIPVKPKLKIDIEEFHQMEQIKERLDRQLAAIHQAEQCDIPKLEKNLENIKGLFKGKEKKAAQEKLEQSKKRLSMLRGGLKKIVKESGYPTVKDFMDNYNLAYEIVAEYQRDLRHWKQQTGQEKPAQMQAEPPQRESVREKLRRNVQLVKERDESRKSVRRKDREAR